MSDLHFTSALHQTIRSRLNEFDASTIHQPDLKRAAVAIVLVASDRDPKMSGLQWRTEQRDDAAIVITRRSSRLKKHAGQWALPGGRVDPGESTVQTALRELEEEVGVALDPNAVLGQLDDYPTRSGFRITPVIIWGGNDSEFSANPDEVASIHRLPLAELMRDDAPLLDTIPESPHPVLRMPIGDAWIAAPTAAILYQFKEVAIAGRQTRVAHFEEPYFAWK